MSYRPFASLTDKELGEQYGAMTITSRFSDEMADGINYFSLADVIQEAKYRYITMDELEGLAIEAGW